MEIDYASTLAAVKPASFVPDVAPQTPATPSSSPLTGDAPGETAATSFRDTVKSLLGDVNDKMTTASQMSVDLATGKSHDLDATVKSVEEASLAFQFTMSMRNKLMEAYQEIQQMQF